MIACLVAINGVDWNGALVPCQKCVQPIIIKGMS